MKKTTLYFVIIFFASFLCGNAQNAPSEFEILVNHLEENGNFINSEMSPALISPDELKKNLKNEKYLVLDIRTESWFDYGHIKNAKNLKAADLLSYFENDIDPASFEKITIICYSGQSASYFASLLRLAGYSNVYSLEWGMSSWRVDFAENSWLKNLNSDYIDQLEANVNAKPEKGAFPVLETGKTEGAEILKARLETLFAVPYKDYIIKAPAVFETPTDYYVINYGPEDIYAAGHMPGAVNYLPHGSLNLANDLATLPVDKRIAMYDSTGLGTAYTIAYLNLIGYNAGNVAYGANSFMSKTLKSNDWDAFSKKEVNMFPVIE